MALLREHTAHSGWSSACVAAGMGKPDVLRLLASSGADLNAPDSHGRSPVYRAARRGHTECLQVLATAGCDMNASDELEGCPPAYYAAMDGNVGVLRALFQAGADLGKANVTGETPLSVALRCKRTAAANYLQHQLPTH